jgi:cell division protein FtsZ
MSGAGSALMGIGSARGEGRAVQAAGKAINSPLLEASMDGAHGVLLSVAGGSDLGLFEINEAASLVQEAAHPDANIIFGTVIDDSLGDEVRVTVIAAGFDSGTPTHKKLDPAAFRAPRPDSGSTARPSAGSSYNGAGNSYGGAGNNTVSNGNGSPRTSAPSPAPMSASHPGPSIPPQSTAPHGHSAPVSPPPPPLPPPPVTAARRVTDFEDDEVDVPPFMRR